MPVFKKIGDNHMQFIPAVERLPELMASEKQQKFGQAKLEHLPQYGKVCEVRHSCHGDCPKHRSQETQNGKPRVSYLCRETE